MKCDFIKTQEFKEKLYYNKKVMVDIKINYPALKDDYPYSNRRFNMYYRQKAQRNYRYIISKLYPAAVKQYNLHKSQNFPFNSFEFVEVFETTYCKKPIISLFYDIYEFTGGAHGNTTRKGNTWDMKKNSMLALRELFVDGFNYTPVIFKYIESEAKRRQITGKAHYFDNLEENLRKHFDPNNFYLTDKGLAIFYPLYTISPYSDGIQVFIIPYPLLGSNLKY